MSDNDMSFLDRLNTLTNKPAHRDADEDAADDLGVCGWLHGMRERALMLELRFKTGNALALGYAWLERVEFDPTEGIVLHFVNAKVTLKGRNLREPLRPNVRLVDGILRQRVPWIQEADHAQLARSPEDATIVTSITIDVAGSNPA